MADPNSESRSPLVYPVLAVGLLCFASSSILVRFGSEGPGMAIAAWRTCLAVLFLAPAALRLKPAEWRFSGRDLLLITAAGVLLAMHFVLWIESLYLTSVASATVLVSTSPVFLALLGFLLLGERLTPADLFGILLATAGAALIGWSDASGASNPNSFLGNALALSGAFVFSLYLIIGRVVRQRTSWLAYTLPLYTVVAVAVLAVALVRGTPLTGYSTSFYLLCGAMALGPQLLGHGSFNFAIRYFSTAFLGLLSLLEPVGATLMAYFFFCETPGPLAVAGIVLVLASLALVILKHRSQRGVQPPVTVAD